jgi:hypothetical protein
LRVNTEGLARAFSGNGNAMIFITISVFCPESKEREILMARRSNQAKVLLTWFINLSVVGVGLIVPTHALAEHGSSSSESTGNVISLRNQATHERYVAPAASSSRVGITAVNRTATAQARRLGVYSYSATYYPPISGIYTSGIYPNYGYGYGYPNYGYGSGYGYGTTGYGYGYGYGYGATALGYGTTGYGYGSYGYPYTGIYGAGYGVGYPNYGYGTYGSLYPTVFNTSWF